MRLTCPKCDAAYEVSPILLAGHQTVRCARCGHNWTPPEAEGLVAVPPPPEPAEVEEPPAPRLTAESRPSRPSPLLPRRRRRPGLLAAWILSFVVIALGLWAVVAYRGDIMRAWPPSTRAYSAIGLSHTAPR